MLRHDHGKRARYPTYRALSYPVSGWTMATGTERSPHVLLESRCASPHCPSAGFGGKPNSLGNRSRSIILRPAASSESIEALPRYNNRSLRRTFLHLPVLPSFPLTQRIGRCNSCIPRACSSYHWNSHISA